jgi:tetratricopeptide (TPR) repeat protein
VISKKFHLSLKLGVFLILLVSFGQFLRADEDLGEIKKKATKLSLDLMNVDSLKTAFALCEQFLKIKENDLDIMTLYSRLCWSLGKHEKEEDAQKKWFVRGREMGDQIKEIYPNKPDGYYWHTVNYGEWVDRSSIFQKIGAKKIILTDMDKVVELNDKYDSGGAYIVIGRINYIAPGGSYPKAIEYFKKAMEIGPKRTTAFLYLGELYLHEHMFDEAEKLLRKVLVMEVDPRYIIEANDDRPAAEKLLKKLDKKEDNFPAQEDITHH